MIGLTPAPPATPNTAWERVMESDPINPNLSKCLSTFLRFARIKESIMLEAMERP
jgi:hypothetical protein